MSRIIDLISQFLAHRKGLLPLLGCLLVVANFILRLAFPEAGVESSDLLLHLGVLTAILGLLLARVL